MHLRTSECSESYFICVFHFETLSSWHKVSLLCLRKSFSRKRQRRYPSVLSPFQTTLNYVERLRSCHNLVPVHINSHDVIKRLAQTVSELCLLKRDSASFYQNLSENVKKVKT